ncbi:unnamed protein product [Clonostachys rosea f. rosea IK726]|uniref:Uncharacterized protein n=1 Tax=Clonostachys rosea f. rosea IK726 TaxID=1349383 RepID=A0ACA9UKQ0_BIOOC|nr:unnamed protein product [Clonostachys rosea f. rosea IK726]
MPAPPPLTPTNIKPLHLYRQLLREASYLPPAFSDSIRTIIAHRYRLDRTKKDLDVPERLARGRNALRRLRDANHGGSGPMLGLLLRGFARSGASRSSLLSKLSAKEAPSDSEALAKAVAELQPTGDGGDSAPSKTKTTKYGWMDKLDKKKLSRFATSQRRQQEQIGSSTLSDFSGVKAPQENQHVPKLNTWGKPPSDYVVRANQAKIWKKTLDLILPPLPKQQWELLRDLANGAQETAQWKVPTRRPKAKPLSGPTEDSEWDWKAYALKPTTTIENRSSLRESRFSLSRDEGNPFTLRKRASATRSDRWFRRAYDTIWRNSAVMEQDPQTLNYDITWGGEANKYPRPTQRQLRFLESALPQAEPKTTSRRNCSDALIELDTWLVPLEHDPLQPPTVHGQHLPAQLHQQPLTISLAAILGSDKQILEVDASLGPPGAVVVEIERHACGFALRREQQKAARRPGGRCGFRYRHRGAVTGGVIWSEGDCVLDRLDRCLDGVGLALVVGQLLDHIKDDLRFCCWQVSSDLRRLSF